ncbi:MAG: hypothetical protein BMS9Abin13_512 [Patescibacteria group bacterium]|nr:MAG: hypothetical protein BMS9Abin13_512 [Patescibacteria group bacterium]
MRKFSIILATSLFLGFSTGTMSADDEWSPQAPTPLQLEEFFKQIRTEQITRKRLHIFLHGSEIPRYASARRILGDDLITPKEIASIRGLTYTEGQLKQFVRTLPSERLLRWLKENDYTLVAGPPKPMSLLDIHRVKPTLFSAKTGGWYAEKSELFSRKNTAKTRWLIIRKVPVPGSPMKTWNEQKMLLSAQERVPNVAEVVWFMTTYYEIRNIRLFSDIYVRTSSVDSGGVRVIVGFFDSDGLDVNRFGSDYRDSNFGLPSAWGL